MALYEQCVRGDLVYNLPIGLHLLFLERAGRKSESKTLRDLTIERGGNVVVRGNAITSSRTESVREYQEVFAGGVGNSRMVFDYLLTLSRLGRSDEVEAVLDVARLLRTVHLDPALAAGVEAALLDREAACDFLEDDQSIRAMRKLEGLGEWPDPPIKEILGAVSVEAERFRSDWASSDHPLAKLIPPELRFKYWALISRGEGFNVEHIHGRGWVTGVYYPTGLPPGESGGELRIGCPAELEGQCDGWPDITVRPEAGMLVIMPSFFMHWTMPLGRPGLRTSIAFDYRPPAVDPKA